MEAQGGGSEVQAAFQDPLEAFSDIVRLEKNLWVLGALSPSPPSPSSAALACYFPSLTPAESLSCARRWALGMQRQVSTSCWSSHSLGLLHVATTCFY